MGLNLRVVYGDLNLSDAPFGFQFGADFGEPETSSQILPALLQDGDIEVTDHEGNRTITFQVVVEGANLADLQRAEALLIAEAKKEQNQLWIDPGDGFGVPTVFRTFRAKTKYNFDDDRQDANVWIYTVEMRAHPHAFSDTEVTTTLAVIPDVDETETLSDCTDESEWTGNYPLVESGGVISCLGSAAGTYFVNWNELEDLTGTPYIAFDWRPVNAYVVGSQILGAVIGGAMALSSHGPSPLGGGFFRSTFFTDRTTTGGSVSLSVTLGSPLAPGDVGIEITNLQKSNQPAYVGSTRQRLGSVPVKGAMRTMGRLSVESTTAGLGSVLVYTWPDDGSGYSPAMRADRTAGSGEGSTDVEVSGAWDDLATLTTTEIPVSRLPRGAYLLTARLGASAAGTALIHYNATLWVDGSPVTTATDLLAAVTFPDDSIYYTFPIGVLMLPPAAVPVGSNAVVRVDMQLDGSTGFDVHRDESWLLNLDIGRVTRVEAGANRRVWIDTPSIDEPAPMVFVGTEEDRSDAYFPAYTDLPSWMDHEFTPPGVNALIVTSGATDASATLAHTPAWGHNAAQLPADV